MDEESNSLQDRDAGEAEEQKALRIKHWLLDAAMYQYSHPPFISKKRTYLPDEVFNAPGMSEEDMIKYLTDRGASNGCIKFAVSRYREAQQAEENLTASLSTDTCEFSASTESGVWLETRGRDSENSRRSRWDVFFRNFKRLFLK